MLWKVLHWICLHIWKLQQWPQDWKRSVFIPIQRQATPKNAQTTSQLHSFHTLTKWCSKFSKPGFSSTWTENFQMFKLALEKAEEPEIKLPTSAGSSIKQENFRKTPTSALLTMPKPFTVWITTNWKIFRDRNTRPSDLPLEKSVWRSGSNS